MANQFFNEDGTPKTSAEVKAVLKEAIVALFEIDECDACGGKFSTTSDPLVKAACDSGLQEERFVPGSADPTVCENDGWMKIEHDLGRDLFVHNSCFLDHDDILVRV